MKNAFFFWFKTYIGFSRKESRGFILLIPFLIFLSVSPLIIRKIRNRNADLIFDTYVRELDSLQRAGFTLVSSPLPTFNLLDTLKKPFYPKISERINRIFFSESDSVTLQIVPGIGASSAGRIIKYRERLGGFHSPEQLNEIFGLTPEVIAKIWEYFEFDSKVYRKINLNHLELDQLSKHPYISYQEAKVLLAYRKQHGRFTSEEDLMKIKIFRKEWVDKLTPYLSFEQ
jgi:competence protein ComEA